MYSVLKEIYAILVYLFTIGIHIIALARRQKLMMVLFPGFDKRTLRHVLNVSMIPLIF